MTKARPAAGAFFLNPVYLAAIAVLVINNLWLKPSRLAPAIAGKLSDIAIMVFLPALICLGVEFVRYNAHNLQILATRDSARFDGETYYPSRPTVLASCLIAMALMAALQLSQVFAEGYLTALNFLNDLLFSGRTIASPTADPWDLLSLPFAAIPYFLLTRKRPRATRPAIRT